MCSSRWASSRGDRVTIYLPMIPEAAYAMLACARIGAIHSVVFGGFSPDSLVGRITDCKSKLVITADEGLRGGKKIKLKHNTDEALTKSLGEEKVIVIRRTGGSCAMHAGPRLLVPRARRQRVGRLSARGDGRRRSALHPLHLGLDGNAQGCGAHLRRLSRLCRPDPSIRLRLSRRRRLLVHGGCRLGHRPFLYRLWPARQRRHHADVRGRAELSRCHRGSGRLSTSTESISSIPRPRQSGR